MQKHAWILIVITGMFLCLLLGIFIGRNVGNSYIPLNTIEQTNIQQTPTDYNNNIPDGKIDINTASSQQLQLLPGVGEVLAQRILDYRTEHGAFTRLEDLMNVSGIGEKRLEQIMPYIKIGENYEDSSS